MKKLFETKEDWLCLLLILFVIAVIIFVIFVIPSPKSYFTTQWGKEFEAIITNK